MINSNYKIIKPLLILVFITVNSYVFAQIDAQSLMTIPIGSTDELNGINSPNPEIGSLAFDTDKDRLVQYTTAGWLEMLTASNVYVGSFIINAPGGNATTTFTQDISDIPFQPSQVTFVAHANIESLNIDSDNGVVPTTAPSNNNVRGINNAYGTMNGFARDNGTTPIPQQVIYIGGHGNSINDISRYASNVNAIGIRYGNQNGLDLGKITGRLTSFDTDGFELSITYTIGTFNQNTTNANNIVRIIDTDIFAESLVVFYTAYK